MVVRAVDDGDRDRSLAQARTAKSPPKPDPMMTTPWGLLALIVLQLPRGPAPPLLSLFQPRGDSSIASWRRPNAHESKHGLLESPSQVPLATSDQGDSRGMRH